MHIDLNSTKPTIDTLDFFFSRLIKGGIIIFDDYGAKNYSVLRNEIDKFLSTKSGILLEIPTGRAIFFM